MSCHVLADCPHLIRCRFTNACQAGEADDAGSDRSIEPTTTMTTSELPAWACEPNSVNSRFTLSRSRLDIERFVRFVRP